MTIIYCNLTAWAHVASWNYSANESYAAMYRSDGDLFMELPCHKRPPVGLAPRHLLKGYVRKEDLPMLMAQIAGWCQTSCIGNEFIRAAGELLTEG